MAQRLIFTFYFILLLGCEQQSHPEFDPEIIELKTANYSLNYFRFNRMRDYKQDTLETALKSVLRIKKEEESKASIFDLSILIDWQYSQAYVMVEPNSKFVNPQAFQILWKDLDGVRGLIFFEEGNKKKHLEFAFQVFEQIERGSEFYLKSDSGYVPILTDVKSRNALHITMLDYYGLLKSL